MKETNTETNQFDQVDASQMSQVMGHDPESVSTEQTANASNSHGEQTEQPSTRKAGTSNDDIDFNRSDSILSAAKEALGCALCIRVLLDPRTLPCGHSFCHHCLIMSFDYKMCCPLCRHECFTNVTSLPLSFSLDHTVRKLFPEEVAARRNEIEQENRRGENYRIPLFFISGDVFLPGQTIRLRVFEPRYLLMVERVLETDKLFGLQENTDSNLGALVQICSVSRRRAGDMHIMCTVKSRYSVDVSSMRVEPDTFSLRTANVTTIDDAPLESPSNVYSREGFGSRLFNILHEKFKDSIDKMDMARSINFFHLNGHLPSSPEHFSFFAAIALNFRVELKYRCAKLVDPVERLRIVYAYVCRLCQITKRLLNERQAEDSNETPDSNEINLMIEVMNSIQDVNASEILNEASQVTPESLHPLEDVTLPLV